MQRHGKCPVCRQEVDLTEVRLRVRAHKADKQECPGSGGRPVSETKLDAAKRVRRRLWGSLTVVATIITVLSFFGISGSGMLGQQSRADDIGGSGHSSPAAIGAPPPVATLSTSPAVAVSATVQHDADRCSSYWFADPDAAAAGYTETFQSDKAFSNWVRSNNGADAGGTVSGAGRTFIYTVLRGTGDSTAIITGIKFHVLKREPLPVSGGIIDGSCGSPIEARYGVFDLDQSPPQMSESSAKKIYLGSSPTTVTPLAFPYSISSKDLEALLIIGQTRELVTWTAELTWSDGNSTGSVLLDDDGKPFVTAGSSPSTPRFAWDGTTMRQIAP
jgi:hypothetical protein